MTGEMPCIRCGACASACPADLQPQQLLLDLRADGLTRALQHGLLDCTECGHCDAVCPSQIALLGRFRLAKNSARQTSLRRQKADAARERFEKRRARLQRDSDERAISEAIVARQATSTDAVAAAIERARLRRLPPGNKS